MQTMIVCEEIGELLEQLGLARKEKGFERLSYAIAVTAKELTGRKCHETAVSGSGEAFSDNTGKD